MFKKLYDLFISIANEFPCNITQLDDLKFKIVFYGDLMDTYFMLGEVQERINKVLSDDYKLVTVYGDGKDALFNIVKV